jgi:murein DD-endopeptidase MepM/ murein hydrolase activator NlpD
LVFAFGLENNRDFRKEGVLVFSTGSRLVVPALILASFIPVGASAQSTEKQQPAPQLKTTTEPQPAEQEQEKIIVPPAPYIIKRNPNAFIIPAEGIVLVAPNSTYEPKYEERPAASTSVRIGSLFGYRRDPFTRRAKFHSGVDIKAKWGDPVGASHPGAIQFAGWYHGYGNLIIVDHGGGVTTYYAHLTSFELGAGDKVGRGTIVGYAGSTGRATSPHLHYEVRFEGNPMNPLRPLALDPSNGFFNRSRPTQETVRGELSPGATTIEKKN